MANVGQIKILLPAFKSLLILQRYYIIQNSPNELIRAHQIDMSDFHFINY